MFLFFLLTLFVSGQTTISAQAATEDNKSKFYVERVIVFSKYDPAFVLEVANSVLPPNKAVSETDVECLINVLEDSGLFHHVRTVWSSSAEDTRRLTLYCYPKPGRRNFVVSRVSLLELPEVNAAEFSKRLAKKGIAKGVPLLRFTYKEINDMADDSIRESALPDVAKEATGSAWISFKPDAKGKIEIVVSANRPQCRGLRK